MKGGTRKRGKSWSYYFDTAAIGGKRKKIEKGGFRTKKRLRRPSQKPLQNITIQDVYSSRPKSASVITLISGLRNTVNLIFPIKHSTHIPALSETI